MTRKLGANPDIQIILDRMQGRQKKAVPRVTYTKADMDKAKKVLSKILDNDFSSNVNSIRVVPKEVFLIK